MLKQLISKSRLSMALLWTCLVVSDSTAQLLFKSAAIRLTRPTPTLAWVAMVAQSWRAWSAVASLLVTFGLWMLVLRRAKLSTAYPVTALTLIAIVAGSRWFFGETISPIQYVGVALIVGGVAALKPLDA